MLAWDGAMTAGLAGGAHLRGVDAAAAGGAVRRSGRARGPARGARAGWSGRRTGKRWPRRSKLRSREIRRLLGADRAAWRWGSLHRIYFRHPLNRPEFHRGPIERPGDAYTVNATSGASYAQSSGASFRQIIDLADWDRSVMTNVPGESGDPTARHYADLLEEWAEGRYHPMLFSRRRVEAATRERITLMPNAASAIAKPAAASAR